MGFFSWNCKGCGESIKAPYDLPKSVAWHNDAVCVGQNGTRLVGEYDGYGRINGLNVEENSDGTEPELWHQRCWVEADRPDYTGVPSTYAQDQGYFYPDPDDHD